MTMNYDDLNTYNGCPEHDMQVNNDYYQKTGEPDYKMSVMRNLIIFVMLLSVFAFSSCIEKEAKLRFSTKSIVNPENIKIEYYSPDPPHCVKMYYIDANYEASEIILQCKNTNNIYIANKEAESPSYYYCERGQWSAELISPNRVKLVLYKIDYEPDPDPDDVYYPYYNHSYLDIASNKEDDILSTGINITRYPGFSNESE